MRTINRKTPLKSGLSNIGDYRCQSLLRLLREDIDTLTAGPLASAPVKKIRRKTARQELKIPTFVVGYAAPEPLPPGFLAAWFDQEYGVPLQIQLVPGEVDTMFEARHGPWAALADTNLPSSIADPWHERLGWGHRRAAQVLPLRLTSRDSRDIILHVTRLARGLTLLTGGTAHDTATETYLNPSDWSDRLLRTFQISEHLRIEQVSGREDGRIWFHTRGLSKFGLEDIELYRPVGLSERPVLEFLTELAENLIDLGKAPNVGEVVRLGSSERLVRIVRHRTDQSYGIRLNLREVEWAP